MIIAHSVTTRVQLFTKNHHQKIFAHVEHVGLSNWLRLSATNSQFRCHSTNDSHNVSEVAEAYLFCTFTVIFITIYWIVTRQQYLCLGTRL